MIFGSRLPVKTLARAGQSALAVLGLLAGLASVPTAHAAASPERMLARVRTLTAPELAGRGSGTAELAAAADTLSAWLAAAGLRPGFGDAWQQPFDLHGTGWADNDLGGLQDRNVAGLLPGRGALAGRFVIIGAHYDHLGRVVPAVPGAPPPAAAEYYPGANDNASGVTVVCELAGLLQDGGDDRPDRRSLLVVFFGGEEVGLQGSAHFVQASPVPLDSVDVMVNFDTVGQITDDRLYVSGVGTSARLPGLVTAANTAGLALTLGAGGWSGSDHMTFNTREVPVLFVFGGPYPQYNRPADTWDTLTPAGLVAVAQYASRLVAALLTEPGPQAWVMVATPELRDDDQTAANRDTWFGSLPDFTEDMQGYRLAGVFDGSPAARAGLQKGDTLVRLAGSAIIDLASFTRALRAHQPGDLVEVEVLRDGQRLRFTVVLGNRSERQ